jgi:hypothetical protein
VFPGGKLGLEVDTGGSCRLTAVERATGSAQGSATVSKKGKKKKTKGLVKKATLYYSDGKAVTAFSASFRVVCGFPFPESAPLETVSFKSIPAVSTLSGGSGVIQGSFALAQQEGSSLPPTSITVSIQGDNSNGYSVRVYERRTHCEGGTTFNARRVP